MHRSVNIYFVYEYNTLIASYTYVYTYAAITLSITLSITGLILK